MTNTNLQKIPWGAVDSLTFSLPEGWELLGSFTPASLTPVADISTALEQSLAHPVGSTSLDAAARGRKKVAVVVDDVSRPTPARLLIGRILDALESAGINSADITIVGAPGLHRVMEHDDMLVKVGQGALARVKWESHDCRDSTRLVYMGKTDRGTPVHINRTVAEADFRVLIGTIEPHPHAGFGGGLKNILPGVAGVDSIAANHAICADPRYFFLLGTDPDSNPMRSDLEQAAGMLKGQTFIVNTVLDAGKQIVGIVSGDPVGAHREGVKLARQVFGVKIPAQADVVITDSFPMDIDLRQGIKAVANVLFSARPGGVIIAALKCEEGLGNMKVPSLRLGGLSPFIWKPIIWLLGLLVSHISTPGVSPEERFSTYFMLRALLQKQDIYLRAFYRRQVQGMLPGVQFFSDFNEALQAAALIYPKAKVIIFPHGGAIYPELPCLICGRLGRQVSIRLQPPGFHNRRSKFSGSRGYRRVIPLRHSQLIHKVTSCCHRHRPGPDKIAGVFQRYSAGWHQFKQGERPAQVFDQIRPAD